MTSKNKLYYALLFMSSFGFGQSSSDQLKELINSALERDGQYQQQNLELQYVDIDQKRITDTFLPKVELTGRVGYMDTRINYTSPEFGIPRVPPLFPGMMVPSQNNTLGISGFSGASKLQASVVLYSGGKVGHLKKALNEKKLSQQELLSSSKNEVITSIAKIYDQFALVHQSKKVLDESKKRLEINRKTAEKILKKLKILKDKIENFEKLEKELEDLKQYIIMLKETSDDDIIKKEILEEISKKIKVFFEELEKMEMIELLGDKESLNAIVTIHSGAGGKEACDWAQMLYRMYIKWCAKEGYVVEEVDSQEGDGVGFKSVTIIIKGEYASEILKGETGVHRLVRISPFDSSKRRHTSFASVEILPEIEEQTEIEIKDEELRIDTYRASGARWSACK